MTIPGLGGYSGMWQFDGSSMYPNNMLGVLNDINIYNNGCNVDRLENLAAQLQVTLPSLLAQYQATIAAQWQQMLGGLTTSNLNAITNILNPSMIANPAMQNSALSSVINNQTGKIAEGKIMETLKNMGSGIYVADRINQEIVVKDKDGTERTITILNRLLELVDGYRKDPENAVLSKEGYEKIWEIASKYAQNGDVSSEDFAVLKKIALNPKAIGGASSAEEEEEDEKDSEITAAQKREKEDYEAGHNAKQANYETAQDMIKALDGPGTDTDLLSKACCETNEYNIIEIIDSFNEQNSFINGKETLVEAIFDDCDGWGCGQHWYSNDDARPFIVKLSENMKTRAEYIMSQDKYSEGTKSKLQDKVTALNSAIEKADKKEFGAKKEIIKAFNELHEAIKEAEKNNTKKVTKTETETEKEEIEK